MARKSGRLPKRFPVGTKYVLEGKTDSAGTFHITARYVLLRDGRHIDLAPRTVRKLRCAPSIVPRRPLATRGRPKRELPRGAAPSTAA